MQRRRTQRPATRASGVCMFVVLAALVAGCGGGDESADDSVVRLTVTDTPSSQSVAADVTSFKTGVPYHFIVENTGSLAHELMIVEPIEPGTMDMEAMDEIALYVIEEDDLEAGATAEFDYTFPADAAGKELEFACHISGHYELGMHTPITVDS